jgi:hypothetical protein
MTTRDIDSFAKAVVAARLERGWSKEEAARHAGISSITWKRAEDALPVQDVKRRAIERTLSIETDEDNREMLNGVSASAAEIAADDLNPDLADFTDQELLTEIQGRVLLLASRLQTVSGAELLKVTVDMDGQRSIVSHTRKDV